MNVRRAQEKIMRSNGREFFVATPRRNPTLVANISILRNGDGHL